MKRILVIAMAIMLFVSVSTISYASECDSSTRSEIYNQLKFDYTYLTNLDNSKADEYFQIIEEVGVDNNVVFKDNLETDEAVVLYIQENYDNLCADLSAEEKANLDIYLLDKAISYYENDVDARKGLSERYTAQVLLEKDEGVTPYAADVCKMTIFADNTESYVGSSGLSIDAGTHAWLRFQNASSSSIKVGGLSVAAGSAVTIGTWGNKSKYIGVWYNLEAVAIKKNNAYTSRYSKSINLTSAELSKLSVVLKSYDRWTAGNNCSSYASVIWNNAGGTILSAGLINTPKKLASSIIKTGSYSKNASCTGGSKVYYNATSPTRYSAYE